MNKTTIDWPGLTHTWNPVVGCLRGCTYCYARKLHDKRYLAKRRGAKLPYQYIFPFDTMKFFQKRLNDRDLKKPGPFTVFVGSMTDIAYWQKEWKEDVVEVCRQHPQHTFMFLTKDYTAYDGISWPKNTMQGVTIEGYQPVLPQAQIVNTFLRIQNRRPYFSIEPLMGALKVEIDHRAELVIVGAMTGKGATIPEKEWIQSIRDRIPLDKIHWKSNICKYL